MSKLIVHKVEETNAAANILAGKAGEILDTIRRRAYELFEMRGCLPGGELEDWLRAESELLFTPQTEVKETPKAFNITVSAPEFSAAEIEVLAGPQELVIEGRTQKDDSASEGYGVQFFSRRFDLGTQIKLEKVTARFDKGRLVVQAPKKVQTVPVQAAAA